jgi:hypothetical protein
MEIPNLDEYDKYSGKLNEEIKEREGELIEHNDFFCQRQKAIASIFQTCGSKSMTVPY